MKNDYRKNGSGCSDPTAYKAIMSADKDQERFEKFLQLIFMLADLCGFHQGTCRFFYGNERR